jgi:hypothetical protein
MAALNEWRWKSLRFQYHLETINFVTFFFTEVAVWWLYYMPKHVVILVNEELCSTVLLSYFYLNCIDNGFSHIKDYFVFETAHSASFNWQTLHASSITQPAPHSSQGPLCTCYRYMCQQYNSFKWRKQCIWRLGAVLLKVQASWRYVYRQQPSPDGEWQCLLKTTCSQLRWLSREST